MRETPIHKLKRAMKLRNKIFLACILLVTLCITIWVLQETRTEAQIEKLYINNAHALLQAQCVNLLTQVEEINKLITRLCLSEGFNKALEECFHDGLKAPTIGQLSTISMLLEEWLGNNALVNSSFIHTTTGDFYQLSRGIQRGFKFENTRVFDLIQANPKQPILFGASMDNEFYNIAGVVVPMIFRYRHYTTQEEVVLVVLLDESVLYKTINTRYVDTGRSILLDANGGQIVNARDDSINALLNSKKLSDDVLCGEPYRHISHSGTRYAIVSTSVGGITPWIMVNFQMQDGMLDIIRPIQNFTRLLLCLMIIVSITFSLIISYTITKPFDQLIQKIESLDFGSDQEDHLSHPYFDEVSLLNKYFHRMANEIDELISQLHQEKESAQLEQLLRRRAELTALQAQINPHFLYNTLDSISWMALSSGAPKVSAMSIALAKLFRSGLSQGNDIISIETEFTHVNNYLSIQKMRYEDRFDYSILLPDELKSNYTVKLILQPLVENSIYHGIKENSEQGFIFVYANHLTPNDIELIVSDNGKGFDSGEMELTNERLKQNLIVDKGGYGIFNVNERIRLYFGNAYGLQYARLDNTTYARVLLPRISSKEVKYYVQCINRR